MSCIESMKHNEKVFSRLSVVEQNLFKSVGKKNCVFWDSDSWYSLADDINNTETFYRSFVYRIHWHYKEEPKEIKQAVFLDHGTGVHIFCYGSDRYQLHEALSLKNFLQYEYTNGTRSINPRIRNNVGTTKVPTHVVFENN